jgi:hypothetical protein
LVDVLAPVSDDRICVKLALLLVESGVPLIVAGAGNGDATEAAADLQLLLVATVAALDGDLVGSDGRATRIGDDSRHHNQLADQVALQVSQHARELLAVDLHLELRYIVVLLEVLREVVALVHLLHRPLELFNGYIAYFTKGKKSLGWVLRVVASYWSKFIRSSKLTFKK